MADRTVSVSLRANVASFMASMRAASKSAEDFARKNRAEMEHVGQGLLGMGTVAAGALGLATKAAIDWESAWAGVTKTVDGSSAQMSALEQDLRDMAKELPASHEEIAAVAEAAGQLGVGVDDVAEFTRVMIDLGQTTNISAEEAGTALARFMNVMGTSQEDVSRLGSAVVALGNNAETTEAEIVTMATRLSAAGNLVGATEADVLGLATAMSSVGVTAELGGSAMSRILQEIFSAAQEGGEAVQGFADVAGMSAEEFQRAFGDDPAQALVTFIEGLNNVEKSGGNVVGVLDDLGFKGQEDQRILLSLKGASDVLTDSLNLGAESWQENSALSEEAAKRYETASAQISMAWNSIKDAAIEVGSVVVPIVADIAGVIGDLADAFGGLPDGVDTAVAAFLGLAGVGGLALGSLALLAPRIVETKDALKTLGVTTGRTGTALRGLGRAAGAAAGVGALLLLLDQLDQAGRDSSVGIGKAEQALADLRDGIESDLIDKVVEANRLLEETPDLFGRLSFSMTTTSGEVRDASHDLETGISAIDQALSQMVEAGQIDQARDDFDRLATEWEAGGGDVDRLRELLPGYTDALAGADAEQRNAGDSAGQMAGEFNSATMKAEEAAEALQNYRDELAAMTNPIFAMFDALDAVEQAQDDYNEAVKEHGENSDEARDASIRLMRQLEGLEQAALDGDLSFKDFSARLDTWVERGKITEGQADEIRERVKEARGEAEDFQGDYAATVSADTSPARNAVARLMREINNMHGFINVSGRVVGPNITSGPQAAHGGLVTGHGDIQRFPGGGVVRGPGGPRQDLVPARLSPGEFVVQAPAVSALGLETMRAINQGQMPGGGGMTVNGPLIGEVKTLSGDRFSLPELENDLRFSGAA